MNRVSRVRAIGIIGGLLLVALGSTWLLSTRSDPAAQNLDTYLFGVSLIVPGVLMAAPWSRIRPPALWYFLFITLVAVVPPGVGQILAVNTWSAIHGAGGPGFALIGLLVGVWALQLPAIWSLRPVGKSANDERTRV